MRLTKLAKFIRKDRTKKGMTLDVYSKELGVSLAMLFRYENYGVIPKYKTLSKMSKYYKKSIEYLVKLSNQYEKY